MTMSCMINDCISKYVHKRPKRHWTIRSCEQGNTSVIKVKSFSVRFNEHVTLPCPHSVPPVTDVFPFNRNGCRYFIHCYMDWEELCNMSIMLNTNGKEPFLKNTWIAMYVREFHHFKHQVITINESIHIHGSEHWFMDVEVLPRLIEGK